MSELRQSADGAVPGEAATAAALTPIQRRMVLVLLDLSGTQLTDDSLKTLKRFYRLNGLFLDGTRITDAGLIQLQTLGKLNVLSVADTQVTKNGKAQLAREIPDCSIPSRRPDSFLPWVSAGVPFDFSINVP